AHARQNRAHPPPRPPPPPPPRHPPPLFPKGAGGPPPPRRTSPPRRRRPHHPSRCQFVADGYDPAGRRHQQPQSRPGGRHIVLFGGFATDRQLAIETAPIRGGRRLTIPPPEPGSAALRRVLPRAQLGSDFRFRRAGARLSSGPRGLVVAQRTIGPAACLSLLHKAVRGWCLESRYGLPGLGLVRS